MDSENLSATILRELGDLFVATLTQIVDELCSDKAATTNDNNFHIFPSECPYGRQNMVSRS